MRTDDNVDSVSEINSSQKGSPKSHRTTRRISRETGIYNSSVYRIIRQNSKLKCLKKRRAQKLIVANCAPNSRRKTATSFPASAVDFIFFTDELVSKLVDMLNIWFDRLLLCFAFISNWIVTNFSVGFCCVMFMSTVAVLGVFSAWVTIKYHASI